MSRLRLFPEYSRPLEHGVKPSGVTACTSNLYNSGVFNARRATRQRVDRKWLSSRFADLAPTLLLLISGCSQPPPEAAPPPPIDIDGSATTVGEQTAAIFVDQAERSGLDFVHDNGISGKLYPPEIMGAGAALFDADNDGDMDVYLIQGGLLGEGAGGKSEGDRLYRNDLANGPDDDIALRFTDVTEASGLTTTGYGMGVAVGDIDNDGWVDLYVTNFGANRMLRNGGREASGETVMFIDVTSGTGTGDAGWSVPAVFFDYDLDGWLDLYVGNYLTMTLEENLVCRSVTGERDYCAPDAYPSAPDRLFRNRGLDASGKVTFEDVTGQVGLGGEPGATLGAAAADFNGDGWLDLYVANDRQPNHLWLNQGRDASGEVTFRNEAQLAGCAVNGEGFSEASMGVGVADVDGDGDVDLFVTHLVTETHTLYLNDGRGQFEDRTIASGLGAPSRPATGFGTGFLDLDGDGGLDLMTVNGAVKIREELARQRDPFPFHQPNQLFHNQGPDADGSVRFEEISNRAGDAFSLSETSRGVALGDVDNDGATDVLVTNNNGPVRLLIHQRRAGVAGRHHWLGIFLVSDQAGDAVGARVALDREAASTLWRGGYSGGSYASANDPRVLFGLGEGAGVSRVRVYWTDGDAEAWSDLEIDAYTTLRKGSGTPL